MEVFTEFVLTITAVLQFITKTAGYVLISAFKVNKSSSQEVLNKPAIGFVQPAVSFYCFHSIFYANDSIKLNELLSE